MTHQQQKNLQIINIKKIKVNMQALGIKIDDQLKQRLKAIATRDDRSMSSVVRRAIEKGLPFFEQGVIHPKKILDKVSST